MIKVKIHFLLFVFLIINSFSYSQQTDVWKPQKKSSFSGKNINSLQQITYELDIDALKSILTDAPKRRSLNNASKKLVYFPMQDGNKEVFEVFEHSVLSKELALKYPSIKSYYARSVNNPLNTIRFSLDNLGFHGTIISNNEVSYISPLENKSTLYKLVKHSELESEPFECLSKNDKITKFINKDKSNTEKIVNDGLLRTYRLAVATTGEYSKFYIGRAGLQSGTDAQKKAVVLSEINRVITQIVAIYERELSVTMEIVANNDEVIFLDENTDGYTNDNAEIMLDENQDIMDDVIGVSNYDIGHVFGRISGGYSGIAYIRSVCSNIKAGGVTTSSTASLIDDTFIGVVSHEIGHQFGASHTFNNSCSDNRNSGTAVEPGSGSTIMSYGGICAPNVASDRSPYFHAVSIAQMWENITEGSGSCGAAEGIGNSAPTVDGGSDYTIPGGTPFVLEAIGNDADGDLITYCWEQIDNQIGIMPPVSDATEGPIFRSRLPNSLPTRYFPQTLDLLANNLSPTWEVIPTVSRSMNFSVLVRDENLLGGQTARDDVEIMVDGDSGPFMVTSHTTENEVFTFGDITTITWDVANTNTLPINTSLVDVYMIIDEDFENLLLVDQNVENDGSHNISIPFESISSNVRIMVKAVDNVFFAINSGQLIVEDSTEFTLNFEEIEFSACQPDDVVFNFTYNISPGFSEVVTFSASDVPTGLTVSFNPTTASIDDTLVEVSITGTENEDIGNSGFIINAAASGVTKNYPINIDILSATIAEPVLLLPVTNSVDVPLEQSLSWEATINAQEYELQISTQLDFSTILENYIGNLTEFTPTILQSNTQYYWRVKSINICGEGEYSVPFTFTTAVISCEEFVNTQPVAIGTDINTTVSSTINITDVGTIENITVSLDINHTYVQDLTINLTSPSGTVVNLITEGCGEEDDISTTFDDNGGALTCGVSPAISGTILPAQPLSVFNGEQTVGSWILTVIDGYNEDGGAINSFRLDICVDGVFEEDADGDGVVDTLDLCPDTPSGAIVDVDGCPIFTLPIENYLVKITSESCRGSNDGSVSITATEELNYTATLSGAENDSQSFTSEADFLGLQAGNYSVCITVDGQPDYEQCFDIVLTEPEPLSVASALNTESEIVNLNLDGASLYSIELNDVITQTSSKNIALKLEKGSNSLIVTTEKSCQGVYKEEFFVGGNFSVYPNPFTDHVVLYTGVNNKVVNIDVYSVLGKIVSESTINTNERGEAVLELQQLSKGIYFVKIKGEKLNSTYKVIKE